MTEPWASAHENSRTGEDPRRSSAIAHADPNGANRRDQRVIQRHQPLLIRHFGDRNRSDSASLVNDHAIELPAADQLHSLVPEPRGQHAIIGHRAAAALHVAENRGPRFQTGPHGDLFRQHFADAAQPNWIRRIVYRYVPALRWRVPRSARTSSPTSAEPLASSFVECVTAFSRRTQ